PALPAETMTEALAVVAAAREALTAARTTVEGDVVRVVFELDPTRASPVQLLVVSGMMLFVRSADPAVRDLPAEDVEGDDYGVPGVPDAAVAADQPPVE
ncbi:MAG: hypothetical protein JXB32_09965, partial [Deltaproteobacteria bacterium]|nr:hypothetical protein [Deltaproteobacteria bacterium]